MTIDIRKANVVLDTNIIISSIGFGGKPRRILNLVIERKLHAITSVSLLAELEDVVYKRFPLLIHSFEKINKLLRKRVKIVKPKISLHIVRDDADNKVLEAAVEGKCQFIITGDKDLLDLYSYKDIKIITADQFLDFFEN